MEIKIEVPNYSRDSGLKYTWERGFEIEITNHNGQILIEGNKAGLISLATQLLTLAQEEVPIGCHFHYDEHNCLEKGSVELVIGKR